MATEKHASCGSLPLGHGRLCVICISKTGAGLGSTDRAALSPQPARSVVSARVRQQASRDGRPACCLPCCTRRLRFINRTRSRRWLRRTRTSARTAGSAVDGRAHCKPGVVDLRRSTLSGLWPHSTTTGTASPSAPRPGPCTRPRTGRCRGQPAAPAAPGGARQGRFAVLRTGRWPPLTRPPKPRAVLDTPPRWGDAGPPARDPSTRAAEQRLPRNQSPSTSPERLLTGWTDSSHLLVTAAVTRLPSKSSSAIPQRPR